MGMSMVPGLSLTQSGAIQGTRLIHPRYSAQLSHGAASVPRQLHPGSQPSPSHRHTRLHAVQQQQQQLQPSDTASDAPKAASVAPILIAVDGTANAWEGVRWVSANSDASGALRLVQVLCEDGHGGGAHGNDAADVTMASVDTDFVTSRRANFKQRAADVQRAESETLASLALPQSTDILVQKRLEPRSAGVIGQAIVDAAQTEAASMLAVVSHGFGLLAEYGSVARFCCNNCKRPLLLLPPHVVSEHKAEGDRVLVAVAGPREMATVARWLSGAGGWFGGGADVTVMHPGEMSLDWEHDLEPDMVAAVRAAGVRSVTMREMQGACEVPTPESVERDGECFGQHVCEYAAELKPRLAAMVSYSSVGTMAEMMHGGMSVYCSKHLGSPLLLLQPSTD